jgi:hypothetical protein
MRIIMPLGARSGFGCESEFGLFEAAGNRWRVATVTLTFGRDRVEGIDGAVLSAAEDLGSLLWWSG